MAGALTERAFVAKLEKAGFTEIEVVERTPLGVADIALYPLFTEEVVGLMQTLIPAERQARVAVAVVVRARRGAGG